MVYVNTVVIRWNDHPPTHHPQHEIVIYLWCMGWTNQQNVNKFAELHIELPNLTE